MELIITFGLWWGVVFVIAALLHVTRLARVDLGWLGFAIILHGLYVLAVNASLPFVDFERWFGELHWNWDGKLAAILLSLIMLIVISLVRKKVSFLDAGLTTRQTPGSVLPAAIITFLLVALTVGLEIIAADGADTSLERLLFQATMPGLDEEIYFRGVLLLAMSLSVRSAGVTLGGGLISWAGILVTILFGLGHSLFWQGGAMAFSGVFFGYTAILGFGLLWLRERTGSIVFPLVAHNLINFSGSFF